MAESDALYAALEQKNGKEIQAALSRTTVTVCGLGGLGSNVAEMLGRSGIYRLILADYDTVDISNLHRQRYFRDQVGMYKAEALVQNLKLSAPLTRAEPHNVRISRENLPSLVGEADIVVEAVDDPALKAEIVDFMASVYPDKYLVAASGMAGLDLGNGIKTRKITDRFYLCGDGEKGTDTEPTLYYPKVMICAAHQAMAVIDIIATAFSGRK